MHVDYNSVGYLIQRHSHTLFAQIDAMDRSLLY